MRLLHIIPSLDWGSAERQLPLVMRCLPGEQFDQRLIVLRGGVPAEFPHQERITALQLPRRLDLASCGRLRECIHDFAPDILHSWRHEACRLATVSCPSLPARRLVSVWRWRSIGDWLGRAADFATQLPLAARLAPSWMESSARFPAARLTSVTYGVGNEIRPEAKRQRRSRVKDHQAEEGIHQV